MKEFKSGKIYPIIKGKQSYMVNCSMCFGNGILYSHDGIDYNQVRCPNCLGNKTVYNYKTFYQAQEYRLLSIEIFPHSDRVNYKCFFPFTEQRDDFSETDVFETMEEAEAEANRRNNEH